MYVAIKVAYLGVKSNSFFVFVCMCSVLDCYCLTSCTVVLIEILAVIFYSCDVLFLTFGGRTQIKGVLNQDMQENIWTTEVASLELHNLCFSSCIIRMIK
jgi:hypothetical protein